ncbi:APC family permease [Microbacterium sp. T2.11-28]|uniref:APC family permease n=1 Tax=Microbacterium sp. T2.11-28 TaxID=3041169 RepID=UPI0024775F97|nr:amino acid permease [Microbacterium sp. T2.11-28]CAI9392932.1 L-methionine/branched-chain amino acid exporter YjeH [Microbacterium sp. T2.11-28]
MSSDRLAADTPAASRGGIGLVQGTALYVASVLGTGLLVLPGLTAGVAGPGSILAVVAVLGLSVPLAGVFAVLAARYPDPGGVASYVRRALGATAARMTGYWFLFGVCAGAPVVSVLGAEYVVAALGVDRVVVPLLAAAIFVPPFVLNALGVRVAGSVQFVLTALLLAVVVFVVGLGAPSVDPARLTPFLPHGWAGVATAVSMFVWAFAGWEVGTHISGEFARPRRDIPIATAIALAVTGGCYLILQVVTVGALGARAGEGQVPLLDLARLGSPRLGPIAVGIIAAIVALGVLNAYLAAFAKLGASLADNGDLPRWFSPGVEHGGIPRRALALTGAVTALYFALMVATGLELTPFILVHTSSMVAIYAVGMVAAVRLLPRASPGWWMAVVAAVLCAGMLALAWASLLPALGLAAAAVVVTAVRRVGGRLTR